MRRVLRDARRGRVRGIARRRGPPAVHWALEAVEAICSMARQQGQQQEQQVSSWQHEQAGRQGAGLRSGSLPATPPAACLSRADGRGRTRNHAGYPRKRPAEHQQEDHCGRGTARRAVGTGERGRDARRQARHERVASHLGAPPGLLLPTQVRAPGPLLTCHQAHRRQPVAAQAPGPRPAHLVAKQHLPRLRRHLRRTAGQRQAALLCMKEKASPEKSEGKMGAQYKPAGRHKRRALGTKQ